MCACKADQQVRDSGFVDRGSNFHRGGGMLTLSDSFSENSP